ncbi:MAG: ABC transporter ATP-binding protein [Oscillospiraceae bacterium]|nr:ABC transporter ATP-binding protein [Oscillospiraceae bacterium]
MNALTLDNVSYTYPGGTSPVVKGASFGFEAGTIYAVVGPSGSGKSTLLSMLAGLDMPGSGDVILQEENLKTLDLDKYRREGVSIIFQAFCLLPLLTVRENVCLPMEMQGIPEANARERAAEALVKVGIEESKHKRFPSALSGGEQQRVAIARSLCSGAPVLLADEPTGNLDGENTRIVMDILRRLAHEEGRCVIVVTHDPEVAEAADRVLRMKDGVLTAE